MSQLGTVYATKRRRRNGKSLKPPPKDGVTKSNPSKRHRERLNAELDLLASLLPFEQNILSKLDRLSILRLSVSYLRTKSYFQVVMHKEKEESSILSHLSVHDGYRSRELGAFEHSLLDGDMFLQALNGFLMILTCEGEVFFATHSIESYLGFHQSDIVHQSVYELVHSEDREELQRQLLWNSLLPADLSGISLAEALGPEKLQNLERSFTVRFRCLLDNTSGFLRLDIRGRIKVLHGQNRKTEDPPLALFAFCTPFGPPSLLELPQKENMFKSKHKLDLSLVSMDQRGKLALGYSDAELINMGGYDLVHYDDLAYVASAHQELLKTGASGMIAYRFQKKEGEWQWLQTSSRLVYKNSKPDFVICTHRQLMEEEGRDLLGKRTMDFKVSYLDTGLATTYFSEADQLVVAPSNSPNVLPPPVTPQRPNRRYKTQLRDFLSTCRSKRKLQQTPALGQVTPPAPVVEYISDPAAAVAAAYSNLNPMYTASPYTPADNLYITPSVHSSNFYPVTENLFHQYRLPGVGGYYTDYHHSSASSPYVANGFLSYDSYSLKEDKWQDANKYYSNYSSGYGSPTSTSQIPTKTPKSSPHIMEIVSCSSNDPSPVNTTPNNTTSGSNATTPVTTITPKIENSPTENYERQTVLMWGTAGSVSNESGTAIPVSVVNSTTRSPIHTPSSNGGLFTNDHQQQEKLEDNHMKWNGDTTTPSSAVTKEIVVSPDGSIYQVHHHASSEMIDSTPLYPGNAHHMALHHNGNHHHSQVRADVIMQTENSSQAVHSTHQHHQSHSHGTDSTTTQISGHLSQSTSTNPLGSNSSCEIVISSRNATIGSLSYQTQQHQPQQPTTRIHGYSPSASSPIVISPSASSKSPSSTSVAAIASSPIVTPVTLITPHISSIIITTSSTGGCPTAIIAAPSSCTSGNNNISCNGTINNDGITFPPSACSSNGNPSNSGICSSNSGINQHLTRRRQSFSNITSHTALTYASPNTYIDHQHPDGSPLLSFSEVTNTLLNQ
ncbi:hypoxia-inducible factor 1-alpha isoform X2 [Condylostylus longicornis]|uniref:hypoxia-inducible factor 1-alpha isoform X2 n=1 Tax=Condylostylus longicornis TaxID=2530218 RepID=UPI00244E2BDE|nr:hypoxia-inducible factor 1-alpha isoform X2 [Condylostylus longicornis]